VSRLAAEAHDYPPASARSGRSASETEKMRRMDWLTFTATVIGSITWPVVVLILLFPIRNRIADFIAPLAQRLVKAKLPGGTELEFRNELEKAEEKREALAIEGKLVATETPDEAAIVGSAEDPYLKLVQVSPEAAILQSFKVVEASILENRSELPNVKSNNLLEFVRQLHRAEVIDAQLVEQFQRVRNLRNFAVHASEPFTITTGEAIEYRNLCRSLAAGFRQAFEKLHDLSEPRPLSSSSFL
jgi:hypothetical protein